MDGGDPDIDAFLAKYTSDELRIASEFLSTWFPFLSPGLCPTCTSTLTHRIRSLHSEIDVASDSPSNNMSSSAIKTPDNAEEKEFNENRQNSNTSSWGSWKGAVDMNDTATTNSLGGSKGAADINDTADTDSFGSLTERAINLSGHITEASTSHAVHSAGEPGKISWADLAYEDELEGNEENEVSGNSFNGHARSGDDLVVVNSQQKPKLSRDRREFIRFSNVKRIKDFICFERIKGKLVNILEGLELHTGIFSAVEQQRIVDSVYTFQEKGKKGELKARTYTAPAKWMKGKGRVTIQFGCCYNYAYDKNGNPPGILQGENVDPIPDLLKVMIRRLVRWHVLPPSCVPDSCIINIYDKGDCIPPHIDSHDFVRPFCTVSFLSECNILFGSNLSIVAPGVFNGPMAIPLPVGSVLVLSGNGADVAKHCVPAVPTKRISITFRKMDESKWPHNFVPEPDLQGLEPLSYGTEISNLAAPHRPSLPESDDSQVHEPFSYEFDSSDRGILPRPRYPPIRQQSRNENYRDKSRNSFGRDTQLGSSNSRKARLNLNY